MQDVPAPPPAGQEWPQREVENTLRQELALIKQQLIGTRDFPGAIPLIRADIKAADERREADVAKLHQRLDDMPDTIIQRLNGTYVRTDDLPFALEAALRKRREQRWRWLAGQGGRVFVGVLILVLVALFTTLLHIVNGNLP